MNDRLALRMAALAVAQGAICGKADPYDLNRLVGLAERQPEGCALRGAAVGFVDAWVELDIEGQAERLPELGRALRDRLIATAMPVPPGQERADLHG